MVNKVALGSVCFTVLTRLALMSPVGLGRKLGLTSVAFILMVISRAGAESKQLHRWQLFPAGLPLTSFRTPQLKFYDATNAFPSPSKEILEAPLLAAEPYWCSLLLQDRLAFAGATLACADGPLFLRIGSGTLPGDKVAAQWFLAAYNDATDKFRENSVGEPVCVDCSALRSFIYETEEDKAEFLALVTSSVDVSMATYADDIARIRRFYNLWTYISTVVGQAAALDDALASVSCTQNLSKLSLLRIFGRSARLANIFLQQVASAWSRRSFRAIPRPTSAHQWFSPWRGGKAYFSSQSQLHYVRPLLGSHKKQPLERYYVQSVQLSGLVALPLAKMCLQALDRQTALLARRAVLGACALEGRPSGHPEAVSSSDVLKKLRTHMPSLQVAKQKLAWWQKVVKWPVQNFLLLAAVFGKAEWDKKNPIRDDGRAGDVLHPFLAELLELLARIARVSDLEEVIKRHSQVPAASF